MTREAEPTQVETRTVLSFDICSSTQIVEDLNFSGHISKWRSQLIRIKDFLRNRIQEAECRYDLYNFTGDGWIVLFDPKPDGQALMRLLESLCQRYLSEYESNVKPMLNCRPGIVGIKMGMDVGPVVKIRRMNKRLEYVGRAINLACRLQSATGGNPHPQNTIRISSPLYHTIRTSLQGYSFNEVTRPLKNVGGGQEVTFMEARVLPVIAAGPRSSVASRRAKHRKRVRRRIA